MHSPNVAPSPPLLPLRRGSAGENEIGDIIRKAVDLMYEITFGSYGRMKCRRFDVRLQFPNAAVIDREIREVLITDRMSHACFRYLVGNSGIVVPIQGREKRAKLVATNFIHVMLIIIYRKNAYALIIIFFKHQKSSIFRGTYY